MYIALNNSHLLVNKMNGFSAIHVIDVSNFLHESSQNVGYLNHFYFYGAFCGNRAWSMALGAWSEVQDVIRVSRHAPCAMLDEFRFTTQSLSLDQE